MSANPYESPETVGAVPRQRSGTPMLALKVVLVVAILGVLAAMLLPLRRGGAREAARRIGCSNNLKQIAIALLQYEEKYDCLPPAYTVNEEGRPLHSWRTLILPFVDQQALYDKIDLSKPWDDPVNRGAAEETPRIYRCPSANPGKNWTGYLAVVAAGGCFLPTESRRLVEITDGTANTLMIVEVADEQAVPWMSPQDASEEMILSMATTKRLVHPNGIMAVCVDGHTFHLSRNTPSDVVRALISVAGNDNEVARSGL